MAAALDCLVRFLSRTGDSKLVDADSFESKRATVNLSFGGVAGAESGAGVAIVGSNALEYRVPARRIRGTNLEQRRVG